MLVHVRDTPRRYAMFEQLLPCPNAMLLPTSPRSLPSTAICIIFIVINSIMSSFLCTRHWRQVYCSLERHRGERVTSFHLNRDDTGEFLLACSVDSNLHGEPTVGTAGTAGSPGGYCSSVRLQ